VCFECANRTIERIAKGGCLTCDGRLDAANHCGNPLCNDDPDDRGWLLNYAIAMRSGELERAINRYKYDNRQGWALIFARMLVGYLEEHLLLEDWDLVIPMPTFVGGRRKWDHTGLVVERAQIEAPRMPFRLDVTRKVKDTQSLVGQQGFHARALVAENEIGPALEVIAPAAVAGNKVLVFDDVFTGGLTLREVARKLKQAGASDVGGIVLARQPFRS
jgi:predicted amidophosphoribosyltransferase